MFLNSFAIALTLISLLSCFLVVMAGNTGIRVLRFWDLDSDSNLQIKLEGEIWLSSTLIMYGACFQIISLVLLIFAADNFSNFIAGAMCATGTLLTNGYGMPLLYVKLVSSFFAGLWIVVHKLDIQSEEYPLVRFKYVMLFFLIPLLGADFYLQNQFIYHINPDIITSCCAIIFDTLQTSSTLSGVLASPLVLFYSLAALLLMCGLYCVKFRNKWLIYGYSLVICGWLFVAVDTIISTLSSYIYAMPYHNCPFCIVKGEYHFIGFVLYLLLFGAVFFGFSAGFIQLFGRNRVLHLEIKAVQRKYLLSSTSMLFFFLLFASYHMVVYRFVGGEG